jgi:hypothetical protein
MSAEPDIDKIHAARKPPSETPDQKTEEEVREAKQKAPSAPSATIREAESHKGHLEALNGQIIHHKGECEHCRKELEAVRISHEQAVAQKHRFEKECVYLRATISAPTLTTISGTAMLVAGGIALGFAGCWPKLEDWLKYLLAGCGGTAQVCGLVLTILSYCIGPSKTDLLIISSEDKITPTLPLDSSR